MSFLSIQSGGFAADEARMNADRERYYARRQPSLDAATTFWHENIVKLADQHVEAMLQTTKSAFGQSGDRLKQIAKQNERKLAIAYDLLLQQSDVRWGKSITDDALEELNHDPSDIRLAARFA